MKVSMGSHLGDNRLLQSKFSQAQDRCKAFFNIYEAFGKELEKKLAQEEDELSRAKDNPLHHSQEVAPDTSKVMEEEPLPGDQAEIENDELTDQERLDIETKVLGLDFPDQFKSYFEDSVYQKLRNDLYNKDRLNDSLNFNVYNSSIVKGFNTIDVEESIKYFRENFDLDLRDAAKNVIQYENIEIKPGDMFRLAPMVFLNDTTINFYIKIISKYILPRNTRNAVKNFHFFNTYFCSKLRNEISTMSLTNDLPMSSKNRFFLQQKMEPVQKKLKTWHKRVKLFEKQFILLPINKKDHWFTVIIVNLPTLFNIIKDDIDVGQVPPNERPYILLLDPLVNVEENLDLMLRLYLESELAETLGPTYELKRQIKSDDGLTDEDTLLINEQNLPHFQLIIPRQRNTFDCGVFALEYMESFVLDPDFILNKIAETKEFQEWFPRSLIESKRKQIINIIINHQKGMEVEKNVEEMLKYRKKLTEEKMDDPEEFDIVNREEISKMMAPSMEDETEDDKVRQFVRSYYTTLPKEIMALCTYYFEHNFATK